MRDMVGYGGVKKVLISAHYSSYICEHSIYSFACAIAAAGIRTRVRGCFPLFVKLLPAKGCWEAPVITAGPQPHLRCLILGQAIYHLWFNFRTSVE